MDAHDKAHYGIAVALTLMLVGVGAATYERLPTAPFVISDGLTAKLKSIKPHDLKIFCVGSYCDQADDLASKFKDAGWDVSTEMAVSAFPGIGIRASVELSNAVRDNVNTPVKFDEAKPEQKVWEIWVNRPDKHPLDKGAAK